MNYEVIEATETKKTKEMLTTEEKKLSIVS